MVVVWSSGRRGVKAFWVGGEGITAVGGPKKGLFKKDLKLTI